MNYLSNINVKLQDLIIYLRNLVIVIVYTDDNFKIYTLFLIYFTGFYHHIIMF